MIDERDRARPPAVASWLVAHAAAEDEREAILGDLEESYRDAVPRGRIAARARYWHEAIRILLSARGDASATPVIGITQGESGMRVLVSDLRFALRMLMRRPAFSALAILTLAIGIGATSAIFSVVDPVLFRALPYPNGDRLMLIWESDQKGDRNNISFATFQDLARESHSFASMAAIAGWQPIISGSGEPERLTGQSVSSSFFDVLGVKPALGRAFRPEEDVRGAERVTVLSHELWKRRFNGDSTIVGQPAMLSGVKYIVLGVMPESFQNVLNPTTARAALRCVAAVRVPDVPPSARDRTTEDGRRTRERGDGAQSPLGESLPRVPEGLSRTGNDPLARARGHHARGAARAARHTRRGGVAPPDRVRERDEPAARARGAA